MDYKRLSFSQYFIDQSLGAYGGTPRIEVNYKEVIYKHLWHKHTAYYCVLWDSEREVYQIYFKETCRGNQWLTNFDFPTAYYDSFQYEGNDIQLKAAGGWSKMYCSMKWYIRNELSALMQEHGEHELEIIGWSLGSALAQLCCQDLYFNYNIKPHVFTFGSVKPWYGKDENMKKYLKECYKECYNFADVNDIVGYMVPLFNYFKLERVDVKQKKFCFFRLFNPRKWHTEYFKEELYIDIK